MGEFEIVDGVADLFGEGAAAAGDMALGEGAAVENNAAVEAVAEAPAITDKTSLDAVRDFINDNPVGQKLWKFASWAGKTVAGASAAFGIMYGLNKAIAENAHQNGNRTALSDYLQQVADSFTNKLKIPFTDELRTEAATEALAFPWIDATK